MVGSRVYVGGLPHGVRERDVERFFKGYGRTRDILIKNGYGFVEFEDYRDADDAVYELNGKEILGERVTVEPARGTARGGGSRRDNDRYDRYDRRGGGGRFEKSRRDSRNSSRYGPPLRTEYRLTVENLSSRVSWQDLKDYMRQAGEVTYADAHKQRKNEGVVEFATSSDMKTAIDKLDDTELNGRRIRLVEDRGSRNGRNGRARSRSSSSRSRSRSRRRSRSRSRSRRSSRSRSKSRSVSKSKNGSKSVEKSRSRSPKRDSKSKSRSAKRDESHSRSRSRSVRRSHSRSKSKDNKSRSRSPRSQSHSRSRSRDRSHSQDKRDKSRSASPQNNDHSPDRNNDSNED